MKKIGPNKNKNVGIEQSLIKMKSRSIWKILFRKFSKKTITKNTTIDQITRMNNNERRKME